MDFGKRKWQTAGATEKNFGRLEMLHYVMNSKSRH